LGRIVGTDNVLDWIALESIVRLEGSEIARGEVLAESLEEGLSSFGGFHNGILDGIELSEESWADISTLSGIGIGSVNSKFGLGNGEGDRVSNEINYGSDLRRKEDSLSSSDCSRGNRRREIVELSVQELFQSANGSTHSNIVSVHGCCKRNIVGRQPVLDDLSVILIVESGSHLLLSEEFAIVCIAGSRYVHQNRIASSLSLSFHLDSKDNGVNLICIGSLDLGPIVASTPFSLECT